MAMMMTESITGTYHPNGMKLPLDEALGALGNSSGRVYGDRVIWSGIGTTESLYFAGDTKAFQAFVDSYSKLNHPPLTIIVMKEDDDHKPVVRVQKPGSRCDGKPVEYNEIRYDWALVHYLPGIKGGKESVSIALWPGTVQLGKVKVPANVEVKKKPEAAKVAT